MESCGWMQFQFLNQPVSFLLLSLSLLRNTVSIDEGEKELEQASSCFNIF
jgi:hypothetical protein